MPTALSFLRWTTSQLFFVASRKRHPNLAIRRYRAPIAPWTEADASPSPYARKKRKRRAK